eukprot:3936942-Rhodomonas_salina.3
MELVRKLLLASVIPMLIGKESQSGLGFESALPCSSAKRARYLQPNPKEPLTHLDLSNTDPIGAEEAGS